MGQTKRELANNIFPIYMGIHMPKNNSTLAGILYILELSGIEVST